MARTPQIAANAFKPTKLLGRAVYARTDRTTPSTVFRPFAYSV